MIKLQTRLVDQWELLEQNIKDAKALSKKAKHNQFSSPKVNKLKVLKQGTHQIIINQSNKIKHSKDPQKDAQNID